jgi:hypothetical protein
MASDAEARQLSQLDPQHGPKSKEIGANQGLLALMLRTHYPGHKVPYHLADQATLMAEAIKKHSRG